MLTLFLTVMLCMCVPGIGAEDDILVSYSLASAAFSLHEPVSLI
jgi:hypothetical protein